MSKETKFPKLNEKFNISKLEEKILQFWQDNKIFEKSIENRKNSKNYVFYDGPPFANGLPHYGHILTSYIKDTVPRYFTMQGKRVERRFGWDCHGLPAENSAEKELNINGKKQIEEFGIERFNEHCKTAVMKYTKIWQDLVTRLGRWVDFNNDYKTMDLTYMESILWVFKTLYDKGLIYEGNKVLHYCYRCETPLSNFEAKLDDAYRAKKDLSVTVKFKIKDNKYFLVWTTTPWTLPSNVALCIGKDFEYVEMKKDNEVLVLAESAIERYKDFLEGYEVAKKYKGKHLLDTQYEPLFNYFEKTKNAFKVFAGNFVTTEDGTGIVHIAPSFGEDDARIGFENHIEAPNPVDHTGCFTDEVSDFKGRNVHEVNEDIFVFLKKQGKIFEKKVIEHDYPYCWRCDTPLIYCAIPSWYLNVTKIKADLIKNNEKITWVPDHIKHGVFGKWLEGAKDWAISRNRYFGAPVPVWRCETCGELKVAGSLKEIQKLSCQEVKDLHRPMIDEVKFECHKCKSKMHRVEEVLDCWFESGAMPYAQVHYPFENSKKFEKDFPADFIVEYISQTRGWFYTLLILSTALFNKPPFLNAMVHGVIFAEDGRKMSKRLKNYPDPIHVINKYGSDAMRFYLISSSIVTGKNLNFSEEGVLNSVKSVILPLQNAYKFFITYANADNFDPDAKLQINNTYLDEYIVSKLQILIQNVQQAMESYDLMIPCREILSFIDILNNTYIRRNRRRFWKSESSPDKWGAYVTLYNVLKSFCKVIAPFLPFLSEEIYKGLMNSESVHLEDFPKFEKKLINESLVKEIERVQEIVTIGRAIREQAKVKIREPRAKVTLSGVNLKGIEKYKDWLLEELNVKQLEICDNKGTKSLEKIITLNFKKLGPRVGKNMQNILKQVKLGNYKEENGKLIVGDFVIEPGEYEAKFLTPIGTMRTQDGEVMVSIDMTETAEFKKEGIVRDIVRYIQILRKDADFDVSDRIKTFIKSSGIVKDAVEDFKKYIMDETLSNEIIDDESKNYAKKEEYIIEREKIILGIKKASM